MKIAYLGNFGVSFTTETHVAKSFEALGHQVIRIQEGDTRAVDVPDLVRGADLWVWTQTYGLAESGGTREQRADMVKRIGRMGIPSLGIHLDRWWGLKREHQVYEEPYFTLDLMATADGGHQDKWKEIGVNHVWFPPGVFHEEAAPGEFRQEFRSDIVFVGAHKGYGHTEWLHRFQLIHHLKRSWPGKVKFWPKPGSPAVRGRDLQDLYASVKVAVGDSCLVKRTDGKKIARYFSDRIPETIGRGCPLIHPHVEGVTDGSLYTDGEHITTWPLNDWRALDRQIGRLLKEDEERERIAKVGHEHVLANHTYKVRLKELLERI